MDNIIFELNGRHLLGIVLLLAFLFVPIGISLLPYKGDTSKPPLFDRLQNRMGLASINSGLLFVAIALWTVIFVSLALGLLGVVWTFILSPIPQGQAQIWDWRFSLAKLAALTATLGAVVALPFTLIRLTFARTQTETAVEALFNDKINAAVEDLHAQRQISLAVTDGEKRTHETIWQDDVTRRNGAIDRLEGLVQENPASAERVARMLSVYVRELSQEYKPVPMPETVDPDALWEWAQELKPARSDMQNAVQVLGRLQRISGVMELAGLIDLARANVQGFDLSGLSFEKVKLTGAHLQGANLNGSQLQGANLIGARLQGADLSGAKLQGADLNRAQLQGANLDGAQLQGASLDWAQLQEASLGEVQLQDANLVGVELQGANLDGAQLQGANLGWAKLQGADLNRAQLQGANLDRAKLQGANLGWAKLQGADLSGVQFDRSTSFTAATFKGAAVKEVDFMNTTIKMKPLAGMFGDASVILPDEHEGWPDHWSKDTLDWDDFDTYWRAFQRSIPQDPENPT